MALEDLTGTKYLDDLVATNPAAGDNVSAGDDHIRGIKNVLKLTFPNVDAAVNATPTELNYVDGVTSAIQTQLDAKVTNATHTGDVTGATALTIADNIVDEANLKVSNAPTNGYVLTAQSGNAGGLTWAVAASGGTTNPILAFVASSGSIDNIEGNSYNTMPFYTAAGTIDVIPLNLTTSGDTFPFYRADGTSDTIGVT
jgi:hypothetical protein